MHRIKYYPINIVKNNNHCNYKKSNCNFSQKNVTIVIIKLNTLQLIFFKNTTEFIK